MFELAERICGVAVITHCDGVRCKDCPFMTGEALEEHLTKTFKDIKEKQNEQA